MLKRLIDFFARQSQIASGQRPESAQQAPAPEPAPAPAPEDTIAPEQQREALAAFMELVCRQLQAAERQRLRNRVLRSLEQLQDDDGDDADEISAGDALLDALMADDGQRRRQWLMIQVDWKAWDEIDWQVNELLDTRGITERWSWTPAAQEDMNVMRGLQALEAWLNVRQLALLHVDVDADAYYALIVDQSVRTEALALARTAGLNAMIHADYVAKES